MKKINLIIYNVLFLLLISSFANAASFYISPSGNDSNNGSISSPWKTVSKANSMLQPGDIVYFRAGTYNQTIKPSRSGLPGKYITYSRYNNESVIFTNLSIGADLSNRSYIIIDGIKMLNTNNNWVELSGGSYNIIKNCYLEEADNWSGITITNGAKYNKILNNTLIGNCRPSDLILIEGGSYNLVEGNELINGTHNSIGVQNRKDLGHLPTYYNIIRNNVIRNRYHTGIDNFPDSHHTLIEGNLFYDSGDNHTNNVCGSDRDRSTARELHKGIKVGSSSSIVRNNFLTNNGIGIAIQRKGSDWDGGINNRVYNNTLFDNYYGIYSNNSSAVYDNVIKNNIVYKHKLSEIDFYITATPNDNYFFNNNILGSEIKIQPDGLLSLKALESKYSSMWNDNLELNPGFKDERNRNFELNTGSPMIDAGDFLTKTTNSGNGNAINVADAGYFMDGWGIIEGDLIQLQGQKITARITKISGNTLTLDKSLTWTSGQGVSLAYSGAAPEIGAHEVDGGTTTPINTPPTISAIAAQQIYIDEITKAIAFTVSDKESVASDLKVTASSDNTSLVEASGITLDGSGSERTITVSPKKGAIGTATITIVVSDGTNSSSTAFKLNVLEKVAEPGNSAPVIKNPGDLNYVAGTSISLQIDANDVNEGDKITFSATGLPTTLSINSLTGLISGVVNEGIYSVKIKAIDQDGLFDEESFKITAEKISPVEPGTALLINAGGELVDYKSEKWSGDQYAKGGKVYSNVVAIAGTENDKIYQTERFGTYSYDIPLSQGTYDIKLHFAEIYFGVNRGGGAGSRVFNVNIENGQGSLQNYDIAKNAGGSAKAIVENMNGIKVSDGLLTISLEAIKDNPKLSAIEILPTQDNSAPVVKNPGNINYEGGATVSLQIDANDPDLDDRITFSATGLPSSLSINSTTGLITGKVTAGVYTVKVRATDQDGLYGEVSFVITVTEIPVETNALFTINAGGGDITFKDELWASDQFAKGGKTFSKSVAIAGTENDKIYQTERFGNYAYEIPVKNGTYDVKLHFAEIYHGVNREGGVGSRIFNVDVEKGQEMLTNYDIIKSAGGPATAVVENLTGVSVSDGYLTITLKSVKDNAKISGIEIISTGAIVNSAPIVENPGDMSFEEGNTISLQLEASDPDNNDVIEFSAEGLPAGLSINRTTGVILGTAQPGLYPIKVRVTDQKGLYAEVKFGLTIKLAPVLTQESHKINAGGGSVAYDGQTWESDQNVNGGRIYSDAVAIAGTENDRIYQTERYGKLNYEIPVSEGTYDIKLHFAEIYFGVNRSGGEGSRIFNVSIENGQNGLQNYDIFKNAGGAATAVVETISSVNVSDGFLTIAFEAVKDNPKVSAIEIISYNGAVATSKFAEPTATKLNVFPNPFVDRFTINFGTSEASEIKLTIFDNYGNKVYSETIASEYSTMPYEVDLSNVSLKENEIYFVQAIQNGSVTKYARVIKK